MSLAANTLHSAILFQNQDKAVVAATLLVNGAFAGLTNVALVNALALHGATMTLITTDANVANFAVGDELTGNTSAAVGTILSITEDGANTNVVVEMSSGTFTVEVVDSATDFIDIDAVVDETRIRIEAIEWSVSNGAATLAWANNVAIAALAGTSKLRYTWNNNSGDANPNVLLSTHGVASNATLEVVVTVAKVAGYTSNY